MASLQSLHPSFMPYAVAFYDWVKGYGAPLMVTSARRTWQEQAQLYARWQRGEAGVYQAQPPGRSQHQVGLAFDMDDPSTDPQQDPWLAWAGPWWRWLGGAWGGAQDPVHFGAPHSWWP